MTDKKLAIVTGASRGIGRAISIELAKHEFDIIGVARTFEPENDKKGLFEVKQRVDELNGSFFPVQADVCRLDEHDKICQSALEKSDRIDLLVNNAGVAPLERLDVLETSAESYDRVMNINARGPFF